MNEPKKPESIPVEQTKTTAANADELSEQELASLSGSLANTGHNATNDDCKTTTDTGIGGCPG